MLLSIHQSLHAVLVPFRNGMEMEKVQFLGQTPLIFQCFALCSELLLLKLLLLSKPSMLQRSATALVKNWAKVFFFICEVQFIFCHDYLQSLSHSYYITVTVLYCLLFVGMKNLFCCLLFISFSKSSSAWLLAVLILSFLFLIPQITFPLCLVLFALL